MFDIFRTTVRGVAGGRQFAWRALAFRVVLLGQLHRSACPALKGVLQPRGNNQRHRRDHGNHVADRLRDPGPLTTSPRTIRGARGVAATSSWTIRGVAATRPLGLCWSCWQRRPRTRSTRHPRRRRDPAPWAVWPRGRPRAIHAAPGVAASPRPGPSRPSASRPRASSRPVRGTSTVDSKLAAPASRSLVRGLRLPGPFERLAVPTCSSRS